MQRAKWCVVLLLLMGCSPPELDYVEVKRLHEPLTDEEIQSWLQIVSELSDERLDIFPSVFSPAPDWSSDRSLAVRELIAVEEEKIVERWDQQLITDSLKDHLELNRALRKARMTTEQFVGLTISLGVSYSQTLLERHQDLEQILATGQPIVKMLGADVRPYSGLSDDVQFHLLQQSIWLTRLDRAAHIARVPPENAAFIQKYAEQLAKHLPEEFITNPLTAVENTQLEWGTPFNIRDERQDDGRISWQPGDLVRGQDQPDPEFRK